MATLIYEAADNVNYDEWWPQQEQQQQQQQQQDPPVDSPALPTR
jgi:hypothetical protein